MVSLICRTEPQTEKIRKQLKTKYDLLRRYRPGNPWCQSSGRKSMVLYIFTQWILTTSNR